MFSNRSKNILKYLRDFDVLIWMCAAFNTPDLLVQFF